MLKVFSPDKKSACALLLVFLYFVTLYGCKDNTINPIENKWESLGLEGKLVSELKLIDNYLYACAGKDGLFRLNLTNSSKEWEYLGFADSGLFPTIEYGVTSLVEVNLTNELIVGILTHRGDSAEIGVFRSSDNGINWIPSDDGMRSELYPRSAQVHNLYVNPLSPNIIYAALGITIYKSLDNGLNWRLIVGNREELGIINSIIIPNTKKEEVWAGGETGRFQPWLIHSSNDGELWSDLLRFPDNFGPFTTDNEIFDIEIDPTNENILYFGMIGVVGKTTDKGKTFSRILGWDDGINTYWRLGLNPNNVNEILATGTYLYHTYNGGKNWRKIKAPVFKLYALAIDWNKRILFTSGYPQKEIYKVNF